METPDLFNEIVNYPADRADNGRQLSDYHYQAALAAAKKMRATRQKVRACGEICAHLRRMLQDSEDPRNRPRTTH